MYRHFAPLNDKDDHEKNWFNADIFLYLGVKVYKNHRVLYKLS